MFQKFPKKSLCKNFSNNPAKYTQKTVNKKLQKNKKFKQHEKIPTKPCILMWPNNVFEQLRPDPTMYIIKSDINFMVSLKFNWF